MGPAVHPLGEEEEDEDAQDDRGNGPNGKGAGRGLALLGLLRDFGALAACGDHLFPCCGGELWVCGGGVGGWVWGSVGLIGRLWEGGGR